MHPAKSIAIEQDPRASIVDLTMTQVVDVVHKMNSISVC